VGRTLGALLAERRAALAGRDAELAALLGVLEPGGPLAAVYNIGPGSFGVSRALSELGYGHEFPFAVHDLLEVHRSMLISGAVSYVLHQDVYYSIMAATRVLRSLCDGVRGALSVSNPRVEILTAENLA